MYLKVRTFLLDNLPKIDDLCKAMGFLNKGFGLSGQFSIANVFVCASKYEKKTDKLLNILEVEWHCNWLSQDPEIRADINVSNIVWEKNLQSLTNIYQFLKIPIPMELEFLNNQCATLGRFERQIKDYL